MQIRHKRLRSGVHVCLSLLAIASGLVLGLFSNSSVKGVAAQNTQPNDRIAFSRDGQIYFINPDGSGLSRSVRATILAGRPRMPDWGRLPSLTAQPILRALR